jgi:hypothetical protein
MDKTTEIGMIKRKGVMKLLREIYRATKHRIMKNKLYLLKLILL